MSDAAYDALEDELRDLDPDNEIFETVGLARAGKRRGGAVTQWEKARHAIPMGSLNKAVDEGEFRTVDRPLRRAGVESRLPADFGEPLRHREARRALARGDYENGKLVDAITRGDGHIGERITPNARG